MKLCGIHIKKLLTFSQKKAFLIFQETETSKTFVTFQETETLKIFLYFRKEISKLKNIKKIHLKKISCIAGNGTF